MSYALGSIYKKTIEIDIFLFLCNQEMKCSKVM